MEPWGSVNCFDVAQYTFYDETGLAPDEPPPKTAQINNLSFRRSKCQK